MVFGIIAMNAGSALLQNSITLDRDNTYNAGDALGREEMWEDEAWDE